MPRFKRGIPYTAACRSITSTSASHHSERQAIHRAASRRMDCFVAVAPRNDGRKRPHPPPSCPAHAGHPVHRGLSVRSPAPLRAIIASAKPSIALRAEEWIASSLPLLAMTVESAPLTAVMPRFKRGIPYAAAYPFDHQRPWNTGSSGQAGRWQL